MSWTRTLCACAALAFAASGCANLLTSRAIDSFSEGYAEGDVEQLRQVTSERFERQALRLPEAGNDLKVLNLPKGKVTVLKTEDLEENKRHVTVQVGESDSSKKTLEYHLVRPEGRFQWVVDDVFVTQNKGSKHGKVTKSVTEQMDLLLSVREFVTAWKSGTREEVLAVTNDEMRTALDPLPPTYLNQITKDAVEGVSLKSMRPEAQIDEDRAIVKLPRSRGALMISLSRKDDRWLVTDIAADAKPGETTASVRVMAGAIQTAVKFLEAYGKNDLEGIAAVSEPAFDRKLAGADLTTVAIPVAAMLATKYEYLHHGDSVDVVIPTGTNKYVISLGREADEKKQRLHKSQLYRVSEVTLYEAGSNEVKRLSSIFTAHAVVEVFADALIARDRARLLALSTEDFNNRAWIPAGDVILQAIPLPEIEAAPPKIATTVYQGSVTEVTVSQGGRALTYMLSSSRSGLQVDDVLLPVTGRPNSLKENIELLTPLYGFALGMQHHDIELLKKTSAAGMTRVVWAHADHVPNIGVRTDEYLLLPVKSIKKGDDRSLVELSDGTRTARVVLVHENRRLVVQNVQFEAGKGPGQQLELLQAMREVVGRRNSLVIGSSPIPNGDGLDMDADGGVLQTRGPKSPPGQSGIIQLNYQPRTNPSPNQ